MTTLSGNIRDFPVVEDDRFSSSGGLIQMPLRRPRKSLTEPIA
jgi:hypothetical protein